MTTEEHEKIEETPHEAKPKMHGGKVKDRQKWWWIAIIVILLAAIGGLGWQLKKARDTHNAAERDKHSLEAKVADLSKKAAEAKKPAGSDSGSSGTPPTCSATVTDALKTTIRDAVSSHNYAALVGYMTSPVNVVFAASEKVGPVSPTQAATDLNYLNSATAPWDFALSTATIASYDAGFYTQFFDDNTYTGKSANDIVVSFDFDSCAKINTVFVSANADLLL